MIISQAGYCVDLAINTNITSHNIYYVKLLVIYNYLTNP